MTSLRVSAFLVLTPFDKPFTPLCGSSSGSEDPSKSALLHKMDGPLKANIKMIRKANLKVQCHSPVEAPYHEVGLAQSRFAASSCLSTSSMKVGWIPQQALAELLVAVREPLF